MPKVSVIMSTYSDAKLLPQAIESVLGQTFSDFEFLIINDNSTDNTQSILEKYQAQDKRIQFWKNQTNQGLTLNLNTALNKASGDFFARIDSDDVWTDPSKLKKQVEFLEKNQDIALVGTFAEVVGQDEKKLYEFKPPSEDIDIRQEILLHNCFIHSSILARKQAILQAGAYNPQQQYIEDYGLWLRLGLISKLANLPEIMVRYRVNTLGITQSKNLQQVKSILDLIEINKNSYPGFLKAKFKWLTELFFISILGASNWIKFKKVIS